MPRRSTRLAPGHSRTTGLRASPQPLRSVATRPLTPPRSRIGVTLGLCVLAWGACADSRDILTIDICGDTLENVASVELIIRRPAGFAESGEVTLREGAYVLPLEGPYKRQHRFEVKKLDGTETIMARVALTDGCEFVSAKVAIDGTVDICEDGREIRPTLALGDTHTCALFTNGSVRCFGAASNDKLGTTVTEIPDMVPATMCPVPISPAIDLVAGEEHTCALLENGEVRCWGDNNNAQLGMNLAPGAFASILDSSLYPVVQLADEAIDLAVGQHHTCAVLTGGTRLQCWGDNPDGQLGLGTREDVGDDEHPGIHEPLDFGAPILAVSPGDRHTCVLLDIDGGQIRCWGGNILGQLGYGDGDDQPVLEPPDDRWVNVGGYAAALAGNYIHNCAVRTPEPLAGEPVAGQVVCWGSNDGDGGDRGYLGYGDEETYGLDLEPDLALELPGPVAQLAVGYEFTCALFAETNDVRCWGRDLRGRLGLPEHDDAISDTAMFDTLDPIDVARADETIEAVYAGRNHACIMADNGIEYIARCWGQGIEGQLGNGEMGNIGGDVTPLVGVAEFAL